MTNQEIDAIPAGPQLDALIAEFMEPQPEAISARALRERLRQEERRPALFDTEWYSTHYAYSPDGWWRAQIGTDHNLDENGTFRIEKDDAPVIWQPAREPSENIADAWLVVEKVGLFYYCDVTQYANAWVIDHKQRAWRAEADTAPPAFCRAGLKLVILAVDAFFARLAVKRGLEKVEAVEAISECGNEPRNKGEQP